MLERRFIAGLEVVGRTLRGRAIRYGDEAQIQTGFGVKRERFARGAFGDVAKLDTTLDLQHSQTRRIARTGGGGLVLTQEGADIMLAATLPECRDADDTLALVRAGVLRGFSIEFNAATDEWLGDLRTVTAAALPSIGVVDRPAYLSAEGIEIRRVHGVAAPGTDPPANAGGQVWPGFGHGVSRAPENGTHVPSRPRRRMLWQLL